jgi:hypothetical protein
MQGFSNKIHRKWKKLDQICFKTLNSGKKKSFFHQNFLSNFVRVAKRWLKKGAKQGKRFLLHFYVTIFGHFKGNSQKKIFLGKN